jgi:hypothetical protein
VKTKVFQEMYSGWFPYPHERGLNVEMMIIAPTCDYAGKGSRSNWWSDQCEID